MSKNITLDLENNSYRIEIDEGSINNLYKYLDVSKHAFIITDKNVEPLYLETVKSQFISADHFAVGPGEASKSFIDLIAILSKMQKLKLDRDTLVIGLGGGVVGDISGLVASLYLRGVDYITIPTTTLSQVDSSVGGKVAINLNSIKNVVGTFYHPTKVIVDPITLNTLPNSEYNSGIVEAVKIGLLFDPVLFDLILNGDIRANIEEIIYRAIKSKAMIVEIDEKDLGQRKLLNLGHTLGHAFESKHKFSHGQSIMLGMIYTIKNSEIKDKLIQIAKKLNLLYEIELTEDLHVLMTFDKKIIDDEIVLSQVDEIGKGYLKKYKTEYLWELLNVK